MKFIGVSDGPEFRTDLHQALREGLTALGLLVWEFKDGTLFANPNSVTAEFTYGWNTGIVKLVKHLDDKWLVILACDTTSPNGRSASAWMNSR